MRWRLLSILLVVSVGVVLWWWSREPALTVVVDVGHLVVAPDTAAPETWERGRHRLHSGQRLRAQGDTVLQVAGLQWTLVDNAEVAYVSPGMWQIAGSGTLKTAAESVPLRAPVGMLTVAAHSVVTWQTTPDMTQAHVEQGSALAADDLQVPSGRRVLLLPDRVALRAPDPGSEGLGLDAEAPSFVPPDHGWFAGVVVPVDDEPGRTRALAAVAVADAEPAGDATAVVWRLSLRGSGQPFTGVRRAQARVWTAATVVHLTVTWTADDGRILSETVFPVAEDAGPGWWDLDVPLTGENIAVGDRLAAWSLAATAPAAGPAPMKLAELVLTP